MGEHIDRSRLKINTGLLQAVVNLLRPSLYNYYSSFNRDKQVVSKVENF